jgi:hypothetical protein
MLAGLMSRWITPLAWAALGVGDDLDGEREGRVRVHGLAANATLHRLAFEELHGDEVLAGLENNNP